MWEQSEEGESTRQSSCVLMVGSMQYDTSTGKGLQYKQGRLRAASATRRLLIIAS
eukprot:IDg21591t1